MIASVTVTVRCDVCGYEAVVELVRYSKAEVTAELRRRDWQVTHQRHVCPDCVCRQAGDRG